MTKKEEVRKILEAVMPHEVSSLYIELIKLIDLYNLKCYYLEIETGKQTELLSKFNKIPLSELKANLREIEDEIVVGRKLAFSNKDFGGLNLLTNKFDRVYKMLEDQKEKLQEWSVNEIRIDEIIQDIFMIVAKIELKLKEIISLDFVDGKRRIDDLLIGNRHLEVLKKIEGVSSFDSATLLWVIGSHLEMWQDSFRAAEEIGGQIVEACKRRELVQVDELNFPVIYSSALLCDNHYEVLLDSIFNHFSEVEFTAYNDRNTLIVREVPNFLESGVVTDELEREFQNVSYVDRHYLWMFSLMNKMSDERVKTGVVKQKVKK